jgi:hypothetical protein
MLPAERATAHGRAWAAGFELLAPIPIKGRNEFATDAAHDAEAAFEDRAQGRVDRIVTHDFVHPMGIRRYRLGHREPSKFVLTTNLQYQRRSP